MTATIAKLRSLDACDDGRDYVAGCTSLRDAWDGCTNRSWLTWIVGKAHRSGTMTRQRLVAIALRWIEPVVHLLPDESVFDLGIVAQWTIGISTDAEVSAARDRLYASRRTYDAAYAAYAAAYAAAAAAADDAAYAAAYAADAAAAAYAADATAADDDAADAAFCDVVRANVTIDEVAAALGIDPDEPIARAAA